MTGAAAALAAVIAPAAPSAADPAPTSFNAPIEAWPTPWVSEKGCDSTPKAGTTALAQLLVSAWGNYGGFLTDRTCNASAESGHDDYRAIDWMINVRQSDQAATAASFLSWLTSSDAAGNQDAMARRLGVMYVIWDNQMWRAYAHNGNPAGSWEPYLSCATTAWAASGYDTTCHRNHIHISLTAAGALGQTSYWGNGSAGGTATDGTDSTPAPLPAPVPAPAPTPAPATTPAPVTTPTTPAAAAPKAPFRALTAAGDLDRDGQPDLLAIDAGGVLWRYDANDETLANPIRVTAGWSAIRAISAAGDWNHDGRADLLAIDSRTGGVYLYPGRGNGTFATRVTLAARGFGRSLIAGGADLNRDGRPDLVERTPSGRLLVYLNTAGRLGAGRLVSWQYTTATAITLMDTNGDRVADLVAKDSAGKLWRANGNGRGSFASRALVGLSGWQTMTAISGADDLSQDDVADLVARDYRGRLWSYPGDGSGGIDARDRALLATGI